MVFLLLLLLLASCSHGSNWAERLGETVSLSGLDTSGKVLGRLGPPCFVDNSGTGAEVWHYCAEQCAPPEEEDWCASECANPCAINEWAFYMSAGIVIHVDGPYK